MTRPLTVVVLALLASCGKSASDYVEQAKRHAAAGRHAEAEIDFRKALQTAPAMAEAKFLLGETLLQLRKDQEGIQMWRQAVAALPARVDYKARLADYLLAAYVSLDSKPANLLNEATRLIDDLSAAQPEALDSWRLRGALAMATGNWSEAAAAFRKTMALSTAKGSPVNHEPRLGLAKALFQGGQKDEARAVLSEQLSRDPAWAAGYDLLYSLARLEQNPAGALEHLEAKRRSTANPMVWVEIARHHFGLQNDAEAKKTLAELPASANGTVLVAAADLLLSRADWPAARRRYDQAAALPGREGHLAQRRILDALIARGESAEAIAYNEQLLSKTPKDRGLRSARAALLSQDQKPERRQAALAEFEALTREAPQDAVTIHNYGVALRTNGQRPQAMERFRQAAQLDAGYLAPRLLLGEMALEDGKTSDALRLADETLRLDAANVNAKLLRLKCLAALGRVEEARRGASEIAAAYPQLYDARLLQGMVALAERKPTEAIAHFRAIYRPGSRDPRPLTGLAGALVDAQQAPEAFALIRAESKANPEALPLRFLEARVALAAGQAAYSVELLKWLLSREPQNMQYRLQLSDALEAAGDLPASIAAQKEAQAQAPQNAALLLRLASLETKAGASKDAEAHYRAALALEPNSFPALNNLASLLADEGRSLDEAERLARRALETNQVPEAQDTLAWVRWKKDRDPAARATIEGLARKYPQNPYFRAHLAELTKSR